MNGGSFQDVSTWTISNKMIFFFFIMTIDIGATSSMMFMTNPGYLICGICIAFFALILQLWFFFPLYLGVLSIEIFKLNLGNRWGRRGDQFKYEIYYYPLWIVLFVIRLGLQCTIYSY